MKKLKLGGKRANGKYVIVDDADYEFVSQHNWSFSARGYAITNTEGKCKLMHRLLMNPPKESVIDHKNGNGLDNRRDNLRICSRGHNCVNSNKANKPSSSKYKGVCLREKAVDRRWRCNVGAVELGSFITEVEAAIAYDKRVKELYGEYAVLNFPLIKH